MDPSELLNLVWTSYSKGWGLWVSVGMYLWFALCLVVIARKCHVAGWWAGWVPVVNFWLICAAGKSPSACFWRLVISAAAIVAGIILWLPIWVFIWLALWAIAWAIAWAKVAHERGYPHALGLLAPVPVLSLVLFGVLAFGDQQ